MNIKLWGAITTSALVGAALAGLATGTYFLHLSTDRLEEERDGLKLQVIQLQDRVFELQAEGERLKTPLSR